MFQENSYLSEHNYEETLDSETARTILNFGDDYRNFLESNNSEVQSPRNMETERKSKRYSEHKRESRRSFEDDESDDDCGDLFIIINDLKSDLIDHEEAYKLLRSQGFEAKYIDQKLVGIELKDSRKLTLNPRNLCWRSVREVSIS